MADSIITKQELVDAQKDAKTLGQVISGDEFSDVISRLGRKYPTLAKMMKILQQSGQRSYANYALFEADKSNIPSNTTVRIAEGENAGLFVWDGANLTKAEGDVVELVNALLDKFLTSEESENLFEWKDNAGNVVLALNKKGQLVS
ncbi:hypothetical protein U2F17_01280, partial [Acinetobacter baumannii]